jgi:2-keto-3-deoxy-L-rhamnonate aldolase RhmA
MFDPRRPTLRYRIDRGDCLGVVWLALGSVALVEIAARQKPDAIVLDLQHGLWERRDMEAAIGAAPSDVPVMVRVAENGPTAIGQALDAGAEGVIVPLVETAKGARKAVRAARFPPQGERSGGGIRPLHDFAAYVDGCERGTVVIPMIETERGVRHAREIAAVEGVDMVLIGTGDLALSLGTFPKADARHEAACSSIHAACRRAWTPCGIFTMGLEAAARRRAQGYRMVVTANDIETAARVFGEATAAFAALKAERAAAPNGAAGEPGAYLSDKTPTGRRPEAAS